MPETIGTWWLWSGFFVFVAAMLAVDLFLLGGLLAAGNCGSHHQGAKNQGAEHFRQSFHLIPPFMSGWMG